MRQELVTFGVRPSALLAGLTCAACGSFFGPTKLVPQLVLPIGG